MLGGAVHLEQKQKERTNKSKKNVFEKGELFGSLFARMKPKEN